MATERQVSRALSELGELLARHEDGTDLDAFADYADRPVAFIRDVLNGEPWSRQVEIAEAVRDDPLVAVRSANGTGKDWLAARLALWWAVARQGLAIITGPTRQQVEETLMRRELADAFHRNASLPGSLGVQAYRPQDTGRAGIIAKTASEVSSLTGLHDAEVLVLVSEAQAEGLETAFDAAFANAVGERDTILAYGNPINPSGPFYRASRATSEWRTIKIPASDVPNVREGETVLPGLMTREGVDRIGREYGTDSGYYQARVMAEFPAESDEGLFRREWIDAAAERHEAGRLLEEAYENRDQYVLAVDVARRGDDATMVAFRRGNVLVEFEGWRGAGTEETADRVRELAWNLGRVSPVDPDTMAVGRIVVDAVGIGAGVYDALNSQDDPWKVTEYKGSRRARKEARFSNRRAEVYWWLRTRLEADEIALPDDEELAEELLAVRWRADGRDRVQLEAKRDLASRLGRSPDKADALAMTLAPLSGKRPASKRIVKF